MKLETFENQFITIKEEEPDLITIKVEDYSVGEQVTLTKKELHSFIGTLLHVQQKMK